MDDAAKLARAHDALVGLSVGDALGERFFIHPDQVDRAIDERWVPASPWRWTDDTAMALSVVAVLRDRGTVDQQVLARSFAERYDRTRGYGPAMHGVLHRIGLGEVWHEVATSLFDGQGSFGNGAAMRVAPVGAHFAHDLDRVVDESHRSAVVTHAHPEASAGAVAVAVAAALAAGSRGSPCPAFVWFLDAVIHHLPPSQVRDGLVAAVELGPDVPATTAARTLGSGQLVAAHDTVPFAVWSAAVSLDDFVETFWRTVAGLGDRDTTCAIAGGIVAARVGTAGIPTEWRAATEPLPAWAVSAG